MTITQTVEISDDHRLTIDVPREIPAGKTIIAFTPRFKKQLWTSPATLAEIAYSLDLEPYVLLKPDSIPSAEVRKVITKLDKNISSLISESIKEMNSIVKEHGTAENKDIES